MTKKHQKKRHRPCRPSAASQLQDRTIIGGFNVAIPAELLLLPFVDATGLRSIEQVNRLQSEIDQLRRDAQSIQKVEVLPPDMVAAMVSVATNAWRAKTKMVDENGEPKDEMRRVFRHIEGMFNAFDEMGLRVVDPMHKTYDSGMALKVISFEQTPGLSREEIKETIKPSIIWQGRLLQTGEVIVGTPVQADTTVKEASDEQKHD